MNGEYQFWSRPVPDGSRCACGDPAVAVLNASEVEAHPVCQWHLMEWYRLRHHITPSPEDA
jgi:hypothetical protein